MRRHHRLGVWLITAGLALLDPSTARACLWDQETYAAEGESLPCVVDAIVGAYIEHTPEYYEARIAAADAGLELMPKWLGGLDMKAVALIKLGRLDEARAVLEQRAKIDPDGYATHANLGTLYTFTGEFQLALEHIDRALAIEPQAHFGRETVHRQLVAFLASDASSRAGSSADFLGLDLSADDRYYGSVQKFEAAGLSDSTIDALVAMIAVYGGESVPHIHYALADALALRGERRLAHSAYQRAIELEHPRKSAMRDWQAKLDELIYRESYARGEPDEACYLNLKKYYDSLRRRAKRYRKAYAEWERKAVSEGLEVWTSAGLDVIYQRRSELEVPIPGGYPDFHPRCPAPGVIKAARREPNDEAGDFCDHAH